MLTDAISRAIIGWPGAAIVVEDLQFVEDDSPAKRPDLAHQSSDRTATTLKIHNAARGKQRTLSSAHHKTSLEVRGLLKTNL